MDGHFVPNITFGAPVIKMIRKVTKVPFDVHLMIENPDLYIKDFVEAGADIITVHQEACVHLHRTIQHIKSFGIKAGVALNPSTSIENIKYIIDEIDMVLIMTVNPGFGGQYFIEQMKDKIIDLRNLISSFNKNIDIQVDGGIKLDNIKEVESYGANIFVAGSAIFNSNDILNTTKMFKNI